VECYKRALIPADPHEITINLKLAKIHRTLEEHAEAVAYHRRVVEVCQADGECIYKSYLIILTDH
jgi:anaphase-promoting complex subunit 8